MSASRLAMVLLVLFGIAEALPNATELAPNATEPAAPGSGNDTAGGAALLRGAVATVPGALAGSCTAADEAAMAELGGGHATGSFPEVVARCGKHSWSLFGGFRTDRFLSCLRPGTGIGGACSQCFASFGQYAYRNCKLSCLFGNWCGRRCLDCVKPSRDEVNRCTGVQVPLPTRC